jgi:8-oxo-dGTP pyrophosphatase MutT (NUDIX family)
MATTAIFAEILIVGLQVEAWLVLVVLDVFGDEWIDTHSHADFAALLTVVVLAAAYILGILFDRVADSLFSTIEWTRAGVWLNRVFGQCSQSLRAPRKVSIMRLTVMKDGGAIGSFLDYQRSRMRIARGTALNLAIAFPFVVDFVVKQAGWRWGAAALALNAAALVLSLYASERVKSAWISRLIEAYELLKGKKERAGQVVAAVPYWRSASGAVEFLVVRARRCKRWTLPKGHVEEGDTSPEAAALREAEEEAGVTGEVISAPLGTYRYGSRGKEKAVTAFLLKVERRVEMPEEERWRTPTWCSYEEAAKLLKGRSEEDGLVGREHEQILRVAEAALKARR